MSSKLISNLLAIKEAKNQLREAFVQTNMNIPTDTPLSEYGNIIKSEMGPLFTVTPVDELTESVTIQLKPKKTPLSALQLTEGKIPKKVVVNGIDGVLNIEQMSYSDRQSLNDLCATAEELEFYNTDIPDGFLSGPKLAKKITFGKGVGRIGSSAFSNGGNIEQIIFTPDATLHTIDNSAFTSMNISNIVFPPTLTRINNYALSNCGLLETVTFNSFVTIGETNSNGVFENSYNHQVEGVPLRIIVPDNKYRIYQIDPLWNDTNLVSLVESATGSIPAYAKSGLYYYGFISSPATLTEVLSNYNGEEEFTIYAEDEYDITPANMTSIGTLLKTSTTLKQINIKSGVITIPSNFINNHSSLVKVILNDVETIQDDAFTNCPNLKTCVILSNTINDITDNVFEGSHADFRINTNSIGYSLLTADGTMWKQLFESVVFANNYSKNGIYYLYRFDDTPLDVTTLMAGYNGETILNISAEEGYEFDGILYPWIKTSKLNEFNTLEEIKLFRAFTTINQTFNGLPTSFRKMTIDYIPNITSNVVQSNTVTDVIIKNSHIADTTIILSWACPVIENVEFHNTTFNNASNTIYFYGCTALTSIILPNNITSSITSQAFYNCTSLTSVTLPNSITSIGDGAFYNCKLLTSITIPNSVASIGDNAFSNCTSLPSITLPNSITSIGSSVFYNCTSLTSITLPNSVTTIGNQLFYNCTSLKDVYFEAGYAAQGSQFAQNMSTTPRFHVASDADAIHIATNANYADITIFGITDIEIARTINKSYLCSADIGGGEAALSSTCTIEVNATSSAIISEVGDRSTSHILDILFVNNDSISQSNLSNILTSILPATNNNVIKLILRTSNHTTLSSMGTVVVDTTKLKNMKYLDMEQFILLNHNIDFRWDSAKILTSVKYIPNATSIGYYTFFGCKLLSSITIPGSITSIGEQAFQGCTALTSIILPDSITSIGNSVFYGCKLLTSITLPNSITTIGNQLFYNCALLTSIVLPDSVTSIGINAFRGCTSLSSITIPNGVISIADQAFYDCKSLTSIVLPNSITSIGYDAFYNCKSLTSIILPNSITSISSSIFCYCTSLSSITIPNGVTTIRSSAFQGCTALTSIILPDSITRIYNYTFQGCTNLINVTCNPVTPPVIDNPNVFGSTVNPLLVISVPSASVDAYKTASNWTTLASRIQAAA